MFVESITWNLLFCRHALLFEDMGGEYNIPLAANAKYVREFDDGLTRGMCFFYMRVNFPLWI